MSSTSAVRRRNIEKKYPESTEEECFEEVGLNDDVKPKKRGIFSRFTSDFSSTNGTQSSNNTSSRPGGSHHGFHLPGIILGQSGDSDLSPIRSYATEQESA